jgi:hypothetical protein
VATLIKKGFLSQQRSVGHAFFDAHLMSQLRCFVLRIRE